MSTSQPFAHFFQLTDFGSEQNVLLLFLVSITDNKSGSFCNLFVPSFPLLDNQTGRLLNLESKIDVVMINMNFHILLRNKMNTVSDIITRMLQLVCTHTIVFPSAISNSLGLTSTFCVSSTLFQAYLRHYLIQTIKHSTDSTIQ